MEFQFGNSPFQTVFGFISFVLFLWTADSIIYFDIPVSVDIQPYLYRALQKISWLTNRNNFDRWYLNDKRLTLDEKSDV